MTARPLPPLSLYVHFPWCVRKCPYCDFNSYTLHGDLAEASYVEALERDLETQASEAQGREVVSIFMGGGTPSLFSPEAIGRTIKAAGKHLRIAANAEVTMEANPGTVERGRFDEYRAAGITRVSLGAQSFADSHLRALGRIHSADETRRAARELHDAGLQNFNLDLMYALPGQDVAGALRDVGQALELRPAHLSHYQLTLEQGTVFAGRPPHLPDDDTAAEMLAACRTRLNAAGFSQYEVSAYALADRQCRHNLNYWTFGDYLAIGAGAHGKLTRADASASGGRRVRDGSPLAVIRTQQARDPRRFIADPIGQRIRKAVMPADLPFEFMLNALRLVEGFERGLFHERTGLSWDQVAGRMAALELRGLLEIDGTMCRASARGLQFLNDVLLSFLEKSARTTGSFGLSTAL
jgi:putative oxygen-independent coproporphyrinogen III oxidase